MSFEPIWGAIIAWYLFLAGLGGGAFITSAFLGWRHPEAVSMRKVGHLIAPIAVIIGLVLLINHWLGVPASVASPLLDAASYALAFKFLGWDFLLSAGLASVSLAGFYRIWECLPPMLPDLTPWPLAAALLGGVFVGVGVGLIVRQGGSSGGDDALALVIHKLTGWRLSRAYLFTDLTVLFASLSYIPFRRIAFSLVTVTVSSLLIDFIKEWQPKTNA